MYKNQIKAGIIYTDEDVIYKASKNGGYEGSGLRKNTKAYVHFNTFTVKEAYLREANQDEIKWWNYCNERGNFVKYEDVPKEKIIMEKYIKIEEDWYGALKGDILKWTGEKTFFGNNKMQFPKSRKSTSTNAPYASDQGLKFVPATEEEWNKQEGIVEKITQFEVGKTYTNLDSRGNPWRLFKPIDTKECYYSNLEVNAFFKDYLGQFVGANVRSANSDESAHLEAMIKANKFIPKEEALKKTPDIQEILKECKKRFPIGSKFICAYGNKDPFPFKNKKEWDKADEAERSIYTVTEYNIMTNTPFGVYNSPNGWMYKDGVYAFPYCENTIETNLEKAKRLYPIGTRYIGMDMYGNNAYGECESTESPKYVGEDIFVGIGYVYQNGKWAQLVPNTPKTEATSKEPQIDLIDGKWYKGRWHSMDYLVKYKYFDSKNMGSYKFIVLPDGKPRIEIIANFGDINNTLQLANLEEVYKYFPEERPKVEVMENWCVQKTAENKKQIIEWGKSLSRTPDGTASYYGVDDWGSYDFNNKPWGTVLSTEEFYKKIGYSPTEEKWVPKAGDWVIGWHTEGSYNRKTKAWEIDKVINSYIYPKGYPDHNTGIKNVRKALEHEIPKTMETKSELTSLPEKWCIAINNNKVIQDYFDKQTKSNCYKGYSSGYLQSHDINGYSIMSGKGQPSFHQNSVPKDYTEITFEQFKKWVLKEEKMTSDVPKYVELIQDSCWGVSKGQICKVIGNNDADRSGEQWILHDHTGVSTQTGSGVGNFFIMKSSCKRSTEGAYKAQFEKYPMTEKEAYKPINLYNTKIKIGDNPALSRKVQEIALNSGYTWAGKVEINYTDKKYLYFHQNTMCHGTEVYNFDSSGNKEIFPSDLGIYGYDEKLQKSNEAKYWGGVDPYYLIEEMVDFSNKYPSNKEKPVGIRIDAEISQINVKKVGSVTLKTTENEVKIKVNSVKQTIKLN